jgi:hypothetical protein
MWKPNMALYSNLEIKFHPAALILGGATESELKAFFKWA